jgi:hypothetical protein
MPAIKIRIISIQIIIAIDLFMPQCSSFRHTGTISMEIIIARAKGIKKDRAKYRAEMMRKLKNNREFTRLTDMAFMKKYGNGFSEH